MSLRLFFLDSHRRGIPRFNRNDEPGIFPQSLWPSARRIKGHALKCLCGKPRFFVGHGFRGRGKIHSSNFSVLQSAFFSCQTGFFPLFCSSFCGFCDPSQTLRPRPYTAGISFTRRTRLPAVASNRNNQFTFFTPRTFTCRRILSSLAQP